MERVKVAIIGSGPAGYTAALYNARANLAPVLFAGQKSGGQLMWTTVIENYPGFEHGIEGPKLMMEMRQQAARFGADIRDQYITAVDFSARPFKLWTSIPEGATGEEFESADAATLKKYQQQIRQNEPEIEAEAVIVATGAVSRRLTIPGESEFFGRGVSTCAVCDAAFFKEKVTFVVGGGDSAMEDALALTRHAKEVHIINRGDKLRASKIMQERVLASEKVKVWWNTQVKAVLGEQLVTGLRLVQDGKEQEVRADGMFLAIGHKPVTTIFGQQLELDTQGYVVTRQSASQPGVVAAQAALNEEGLVSLPTMTSVEGVFAGGDVVDICYRQAITAAGQGCAAALDAERWLERQVS